MICVVKTVGKTADGLGGMHFMNYELRGFSISFDCDFNNFARENLPPF